MTVTIAHRSQELFNSGYFCAESVLLALCEHMEIESDILPKIAAGFCSGVARTKGMCGSVSGAIMGLSMAYGRTTPQDSMDDIYLKVQQLRNAFEEKFGSINCFELIECDLGTDEGQIAFADYNRFDQCLDYAGEAARIALDLIETR